MSTLNAAALEAIENFKALYGAYTAARDVEDERVSQKTQSDAALTLAIAEREAADTAAEEGLAIMLIKLKESGIG